MPGSRPAPHQLLPAGPRCAGQTVRCNLRDHKRQCISSAVIARFPRAFIMKNITCLLPALLMCIILSSCTQRTGNAHAYTYSLYVSENTTDYTQVADRLEG